MSHIHQTGTLSPAAAWATQITDSKKPAEMLPGATLRSSVTPNALINSQEMFKSFVRAEVAQMSGTIGGAAAAGFSEIAEAGLKDILANTFGAMTNDLVIKGEIQNAPQMMRTAHAEAQAMFETLRSLAPDIAAVRAEGSAKPVPQLVLGSDGYNLIRTAPKIENIVLKGGGGKGIGYPGALDELRKSGALSDLKQVVGTSAGALGAVTLACGMDSAKFEEIAMGSAAKLLVGGRGLDKVYPEIGFKGGLNSAQARPMIQKLDTALCDEVKNFVSSQSSTALDAKIDVYVHSQADTAEGRATLKSSILSRLADLANPDFKSDRTGKMVTFNDMKLLHALEPGKFKEITLTGWDSHDQQPIMFRAGDRYGDLPVAFAARASMAHPAIATGITLPEKYGHGDHAIQDGGIGSNLPTEALYGDDRLLAAMDTAGHADIQEIRARTAVLTFVNEGEAHKNLYDSKAQNMAPDQPGRALRRIANNQEMGTDNRMDGLKEYAAGPNAFVVAHGSMGTYAVSNWNSTKREAIAESRQVMVEQLAMRQGQAYALEVDSPQAAYTLLDRDERRAIFDQGPPVAGTMTQENFTAARDLFELARAQFAPDAVVIHV